MKSLKLFGLGTLLALSCAQMHAMEPYINEDGTVDVNVCLLDLGVPLTLYQVSPYAYYPYCFARTCQKDGAREGVRYAARETVAAGALTLIKNLAKEATGKNDLWECPSEKDNRVAYTTCALARWFLRDIVVPTTVRACIVNPIVNAAIPPVKK